MVDAVSEPAGEQRLGLDDSAWKDVQNELAATTEPLGQIESK